MRTTLDIEDSLLRDAKVFAAESGRTLRSIVEEGLRRILEARTAPTDFEPLPTLGGGAVREGVDLTNNAQVLDILDGFDE
ncbi:MAG TPA: type II toxin-antitoxin system VapB family antitoxin [Actinomycetota bacterium]|nr:type II toxin-antitoxin system VapB family antitoxin [Actinomycetota bacterium]